MVGMSLVWNGCPFSNLLILKTQPMENAQCDRPEIDADPLFLCLLVSAKFIVFMSVKEAI